MRLVDVHCHLDSPAFERRLHDLLETARSAGVCAWISAAIHPSGWEAVRMLSRCHAGVYHALGVHPWYCSDDSLPLIPSLASQASEAVAIGEIGLDSKRPVFPLERQLSVFSRQLGIARELKLPVILHCRGAFNEMLQLFRKEGAPAGGILHNFSGGPELAKAFMDYGLAFSLGGVLTWRNSARRTLLLKEIYPHSLLLETDAPDIPPVEARGTVNSPANILYNLKAASELLDVPAEEIAAFSTANAGRIFGIAL
ncbi:MAG TPA: TatD family hydrolase [Candidatus Hydrogenedentes bacterium]|jgi:TatD DNase family protein|nr:MAG: putative deoxyribonuclease YjjV [Candidatus Hydrogenedentes bacterium ADurb.Bin170]HNZ47967.1 TatD family hydrolase [Candidatus Hydrogenedentota bacterium]HOD94459.1 TatD family hydrolase [Candidatus Hydrogenedentota bacterium]HOH41912.1 TatD family hydrolase [Candidatus Hydrogenedentota bacterium]HOM49116.1 TatD family hydrolase [Candidatus Hydrogenedentota bacterium]